MNIKKLFQDENVEEKGWLGIKGKHFGLDKQKHAVGGILIYITFTFILYFFNNYNTDHLFKIASEDAFGITVVGAVFKEIIDFVRMQFLKLKPLLALQI